MSETSSIRSEFRAVLPFWSGALMGLLLGFLAADFLNEIDAPPAAAAPVTNTVVKEKTIMPAWMRNGKILTTADGKAVILCDDCPCDAEPVGTVEVGCCPQPVAKVLHATIESDCPELDGIQFTLTWNDDTSQWEGESFSFCEDTWYFNLVCYPGESNFTLNRFAPCEGDGPTTGTSIESFECDPFEWTFRFLPFDPQVGYCWRSESQCCPGSEDFHVVITE